MSAVDLLKFGEGLSSSHLFLEALGNLRGVFHTMMWFQQSSVCQCIRQEHHAHLHRGRFHACYVKFIFHNGISKVAYLLC